MAMKRESFSTLVFDCDDTLWKLDSDKSMRLVAQHLKVPQEKEHEFIHVFRESLYAVISMLSHQKVTKSIVIDDLNALVGSYLHSVGTDVYRAYDAICIPEFSYSEPYPETINVLRYLKAKGYKMVAKSNWFAHVQVKRLKQFGFLDYFELVSGPIDDYFKPNPQCMRKIIGTSDPSHFVIIGDSLSSDVQLANNVGIKSIWINHSGEEKVFEKNNKPSYEINAIEEIVGIL